RHAAAAPLQPGGQPVPAVARHGLGSRDHPPAARHSGVLSWALADPEEPLTMSETATKPRIRMETKAITVDYGNGRGVRNVSLEFEDRKVNALIGPSGCGKTTFLRALNRMHDLMRGVKVTGQALLDGDDIYAPGVDP